MYLVPRSILFKVMKNKRPVKLLEDDTGRYDYFVKKSTEIYNSIKTSSSSAKMEEFDDKITSFMRQNLEMVQFVGEGSSRRAFIMVDGTCLKIAFTPAGLAQNKREIQVCLNDKLKYKIFPDFYGSDQSNWLSLNCELCSRARNRDFVDLFQAPVAQVLNVVDFMIRHGLSESQFSEAVKFYKETYRSLEWSIASKLATSMDESAIALRSLVKFYNENGGSDALLLGDLEPLENWGITFRNGQKVLVVIDAGFNADVYNDYYR